MNLYVSPRCASADEFCLVPAYSKLGRAVFDQTSISSHIAQLAHFFGGEFRAPMPFSSWHALWMRVRTAAISTGRAALGSPVLIVLALGSDEQMRRSYARRIIALVADMKPFWDFTTLNRPSNSVGKRELIGAELSPSVPSTAARRPQPARGVHVRHCGSVLVDFSPKAFLGFFRDVSYLFCSGWHIVSVLIVRVVSALNTQLRPDLTLYAV